MVKITSVFSGFSVKDIAAAKQFYGEVLGFKLVDEVMGLRFALPEGGTVFVYEKADHQPATFTILNLVVEDIDVAVDELASKGVVMARYDTLPASQDAKGILRGLAVGQGPDIAWFTDPSGNILAVLQDS